MPSATVFLLQLCNDRAVLGPWVNRRGTNLFTSAVVAVLVTLSVVLTASVLFPHITGRQILDIMAACGLVSGTAGASRWPGPAGRTARSRSTAVTGPPGGCRR